MGWKQRLGLGLVLPLLWGSCVYATHDFKAMSQGTLIGWLMVPLAFWAICELGLAVRGRKPDDVEYMEVVPLFFIGAVPIVLGVVWFFAVIWGAESLGFHGTNDAGITQMEWYWLIPALMPFWLFLPMWIRRRSRRKEPPKSTERDALGPAEFARQAEVQSSADLETENW